MELLGCSRSAYFAWKTSEIWTGSRPHRATASYLPSSGSTLLCSSYFLSRNAPTPGLSERTRRMSSIAVLLELTLAGQASDLFAVRQYLEPPLGGSTDQNASAPPELRSNDSQCLHSASSGRDRAAAHPPAASQLLPNTRARRMAGRRSGCRQWFPRNRYRTGPPASGILGGTRRQAPGARPPLRPAA